MFLFTQESIIGTERMNERARLDFSQKRIVIYTFPCNKNQMKEGIFLLNHSHISFQESVTLYHTFSGTPTKNKSLHFVVLSHMDH